jgi:hypothetical protein
VVNAKKFDEIAAAEMFLHFYGLELYLFIRNTFPQDLSWEGQDHTRNPSVSSPRIEMTLAPGTRLAHYEIVEKPCGAIHQG